MNKQMKPRLIFRLEKHQVVIVKADTGSGKSTQLPKFLLEWYAKKVDGTTKSVCYSCHVFLRYRVCTKFGRGIYASSGQYPNKDSR